MPNLTAHSPSSYEPKRLVQYVTNRLPNKTLISNPTTTTPAAITKINQCVSAFTDYFGTKSGAPYLNGNYYYQTTSGGKLGKVTQIAIHKNLTETDFLYYWNGWGTLPLSYCN